MDRLGSLMLLITFVTKRRAGCNVSYNTSDNVGEHHAVIDALVYYFRLIRT